MNKSPPNPVAVFFLIFMSMYAIPVLYVYLFGFKHGGVMVAADITPAVMEEMVHFYLWAIVSFFCGCACAWLIWKTVQIRAVKLIQPDHSARSESNIAPLADWKKLIIAAVCWALICAKILLINEGVYSSYAFDSGGMDSKVWRVSMGLSEMAVVFFAFSLMAKRWHLAYFLLLCISINLLHGTRIYFMIAMLMIMYERIYHSRALPFGKAILLSAGAGVVLLFVFLAVFLHRSSVSISLESLDFDTIISPLIYESIFNQISFIRMLKIHHGVGVDPEILRLAYDVAIFRLPKALTEGVSLHTSNFGTLSPLGGMSGFASALIYFGWLYPLVYFCMGLMLCLLWKYSVYKKSILLNTIFVYILCSTFFRSFRDPWVVPFKMLFDNLVILVVFFGVSSLFKPLNLVWLRKKSTVDNANS